jgi:hypothetical protein
MYIHLSLLLYIPVLPKPSSSGLTITPTLRDHWGHRSHDVDKNGKRNVRGCGKIMKEQENKRCRDGCRGTKEESVRKKLSRAWN